jgi:hypothetical protein
LSYYRIGHSGCFPRFHVFISCVCKILPEVFSNFTVNVLKCIIMIQNWEYESVSVYQNSSKLFVLNLYNSTSKILLNGNHHHILDFVNQYLVNILSILDHNDKFKDINSVLYFHIRNGAMNYRYHMLPK